MDGTNQINRFCVLLYYSMVHNPLVLNSVWTTGSPLKRLFKSLIQDIIIKIESDCRLYTRIRFIFHSLPCALHLYFYTYLRPKGVNMSRLTSKQKCHIRDWMSPNQREPIRWGYSQINTRDCSKESRAGCMSNYYKSHDHCLWRHVRVCAVRLSVLPLLSVNHDLVVDPVLIAVHFLLFLVFLFVLLLLFLAESRLVLNSCGVPDFEKPVVGASKQFAAHHLSAQQKRPWITVLKTTSKDWHNIYFILMFWAI